MAYYIFYSNNILI